MPALKCCSLLQSCSLSQHSALTCETTTTGGLTWLEPIGDIQKDQRIPLWIARNTQLFTSPTKTRRLTRIGPAKNCPTKQSGNLPLGEASMAPPTPGEKNLVPTGDTWQTHGKGNSPGKTSCLTAMRGPRRFGNSPPMPMASLT